MARAEANLERARATPTRITLTCQQVLNLHGQDAYARCMRGDTPVVGEGPPSPAAVKEAEAELERAREELRKVTYAGCR